MEQIQTQTLMDNIQVHEFEEEQYEKLPAQPPKLKTESSADPETTKGVVYSALGLKYIKEAIMSARSIKKHSKHLKITVFTDHPRIAKNSGLFHRVYHVDTKDFQEFKLKWAPFAKLQKIRAMSTFPYDLTLYLDCDTHVVKPINELFKLVKERDMLICNQPKLDKSVKPYKLVKYQKKKTYNSGVILYKKNDRVKGLFEDWLKKAESDRRIYQKFGGKFFDQPKLVSLLNSKNNKVDFKVIPNTIYNARHTMIRKMKHDNILKKAKIIHGRVKI